MGGLAVRGRVGDRRRRTRVRGLPLRGRRRRRRVDQRVSRHRRPVRRRLRRPGLDGRLSRDPRPFGRRVARSVVTRARTSAPGRPRRGARPPALARPRRRHRRAGADPPRAGDRRDDACELRPDDGLARDVHRLRGASRRRTRRGCGRPPRAPIQTRCACAVRRGQTLRGPGLAAVVIAEWFVAESGVGVLLLQGMTDGQPALTVAAAVVLFGLGVGLFGAVAALRRHATW